MLRQSDNTVLAQLKEAHGQWVLKRQLQAKASFYTKAVQSRTRKLLQKANAMRWHQRLDHPGPSALEHLAQQSQGVQIAGITTVQCNACGMAKLKQHVRRAPRTNNEGPKEQIAVDFHPYEARSSTKKKSQMLVTD
jgi:hypothetical protein